MKYKVKDTFDKETRDAILRVLEIASDASTHELINTASYSSNDDKLADAANDVRLVRIAKSVLGYEHLSYEPIED